MKKRLLVLVGMITTLFLLTGCGKSIDLNEFVSVEVSGYNENGYAEYRMDNQGVEKAIGKALGIKTEMNSFDDLKNSAKDLEKYDQLYYLLNSVDFKFDKSEGLSNGDKIILSANIDEDLNKGSKVKLKFKDISVKVEGLEKAKVIGEKELFKDLSVTFKGIAPNGTAVIENKSNDKDIKDVSFKIKTNDEDDYHEGGLKNGDKIIIEAKPNEFNPTEGVVIKEASKEYTVEGLDEYLTKFEDLDADSKTKILNRANELINANITGGKGGSIAEIGNPNGFNKSASNVSLQDSYFLKAKDGIKLGYGSSYSQVLVTYKFDVTEGSTVHKDVYIAVAADNILKRADGTIEININEMELVRGYKTFDEYYNEYMTKNSDSYDVETVKFE